MSREEAIAAALDALDAPDEVSWKGMEAALDAAAPHLMGESIGYGLFSDSIFGTLLMWVGRDRVVAERIAELLATSTPCSVVSIIDLDKS